TKPLLRLHGQRMLTLARKKALTLRPILSFRFNSNTSPNQAIVDFLKRCQREEENRTDPNAFKVRAFGHAIQSIAQVSQPIKLGTDVAKLPGIGQSMATRISEFLYASEEAGTHPKLEEELVSARATQMLLTVPGIGPTSAKKLVAAGCTSLADMRLPFFMSMLSKKQQVKVKFMGHLEKPVLRSEAEEVLNFCSENLDKRYEITLVGDYRRGLVSSSDIRLMVTHPDFVHIPLPSSSSSKAAAKPRTRKRESKHSKQQNLLLSDIVPVLERQGLIADTLTSSSSAWEGVIRLPEKKDQWDRSERIKGIENVEGEFRKIAISFVSYKSRGVALFHLTGDADFVEHMTSQAKQSGMLLNEHGLWNWTSATTAGEATEEVSEDQTSSPSSGYWSLAASEREKEIFDELGMEFVDPTKRNFSFVSGKAKRRRRTPS
ncbi:hypothetical protein CPB83DRAFT_758016, partial [Crepidotus variabilis]